MKHKTRKLLSILLAIVMIVGLMPARAFADEAYDLRVGGVEVSGSNLSGEGWVFDPESSKLTLTDANITGSLAQGSSAYGIISEREYLILELNGNNTVTAADAEYFSCGVYSEGNITIMGAGSLTVSGAGGENSHGISGADDIIIESGNIIASGGEADLSYGIFAAGYLTVNNGTVTATGQTGAFNNAPNINNYEDPVLTVNESPSASGALPWDNTTELTDYKYVKLVSDPLYYNPIIPGNATILEKTGVQSIGRVTVENVNSGVEYIAFGVKYTMLTSGRNSIRLAVFGKKDGDSYNREFNPSDGTFSGTYSVPIVYSTDVRPYDISVSINSDQLKAAPVGTYTATLTYYLRMYDADNNLTETEIMQTITLVKNTPPTYNVTFNLNGGTPVGAFTTKRPYTESKLPSAPTNILPPADNKVFDAYEIDGVRYEPEADYTAEGDFTLKYLWKYKPGLIHPITVESGGKVYSDLACTNEINEAEAGTTIYFKCDRPPEGKWVDGLSCSPDSVNYIDYYKAYPNIIYSIEMPAEELTIEPYVYDQYEDIVDLRSGSAKNVSYDAVFSEEYWDSEHPFGPKDLDGDGHYDIIIEEDSGGDIIWVEYSDSETLEPVSHDYHVRIYQHQDSNLAGQVKVFTYGPDRPYKKITYIFGTPITAFNYTVTEPRVGEKPTGTMTMTTTPSKALIIGEITINNISWFESDTGIIESWRLWYGPEGDWRLMEAEETFKEGKYYYPYTYTVFDDSILESGYFWGDPIKYYINGRETEDLVIGPLSDTPEPIASLTAILTNDVIPVAGETPVVTGISVPAGAGYTIDTSKGISWWNVTNSKKMTASDRFEPGKQYYLEIPCVPKAGESFKQYGLTAAVQGISAVDYDSVQSESDSPTEKNIGIRFTLKYIPGDINGDGTVNNKDITRLMRYVKYKDVYVVEAACNVNGDGTVNNKDITRLMRYVKYKDVTIN